MTSPWPRESDANLVANGIMFMKHDRMTSRYLLRTRVCCGLCCERLSLGRRVYKPAAQRARVARGQPAGRT